MTCIGCIDWEGTWGNLQGAARDVYLELGGGYLGICRFEKKKSLNSKFNICGGFLNVNYTLVIKREILKTQNFSSLL